ncbi:hypothetical protein [Cytobacillus praedii]|nr:hypothetical protein [Cytobacillus praedii]
MKKIIGNIIGLLFFLFLIFLTALGIWFFQGGDLRDLPKGCFEVGGCNE